ncbi:MAG: hypothetical protein ACSHW0_10110 [Thalassotalea sp.]
MFELLVKTFLATLTISITAFAKQDVEFYIYFDKPPYIVDQQQQRGLSYDFIAALNEYSARYNYRVTLVPKQRAIDFSQGSSGVLWTNPIWVNDPEQVKFSWINNLIFERENYITNDPHLRYQGPESLTNKIVVGVRGYTYFNLEPLFNTKKVRRVNVHSEKVIPLMLLNKRADIGVIGFQTFQYLKRSMPEIEDKLYILNGYNKEFYRSILIDKSRPELQQDIEAWLSSTAGILKWQALKEKWLYNLQ